jgi:hypothetical protein
MRAPWSEIMAEARGITLTEKNWQKIEKPLARIPDSEFLKFCLMNKIVKRNRHVRRQNTPYKISRSIGTPQ